MEVRAEMAKMMAIPTIGLVSRMPLSASAVAPKKAVKAPIMKTSPWAKLIMNRMP